ncbi:flagellar motor switch protein FliG [Planctopirus limnophila DSM 3776]|uniref:Flagellar motor switch protein FliG n=3 Tax=Planctopirus TaxID=1649480 RepID=D5SSW0_PLAL2|nr:MULTISPECIES: flagellar motor switch protein FliG [Planctopirus]ADG68911.1 flagellar motor switch protein FliG [Planctopirus limnophila DSM 3776]ODA31076.1 flagellar motor switch protein FliG [Planctopirus hydrillae]QDV31837.1 Flagellar motor switch protein FliG [Planctopirus ephydatiae]
MDAIRKAAILLLSMEKPLAAEVLASMTREQVERVTLEIAKVDDVTREQQESVFDEFFQGVNELTPIERGGLGAANELLEQSLGKEHAGQILENVRQSMNSVPFSFLHKVGAENLLTFISEEHPQTIALIMSHLPAALAAEVLSGLPSLRQLEVIRRIAGMEQTSPEVIATIEKSLQSRMTSMFNQQLENAGGVPMVAQILNVTDRMTNKGILESLDQEDSELADEIRRLMFVFDDLLKLDNKSIQALLKEVDNSQWALALKGASEEIKQKIFGNLSQRAAEMLKEEIEYLGAVRLSDVEQMQQQIVDAVRRLEDAGEIVVAAGGGEQFVS